MKKKLTISTALTLIALTAALAVSVTMMLAMRYFNRQLQWVSQRRAMYAYIDEADQVVRERYSALNEETLRQNVLRGFVNGTGDPYASYFTPQEYVKEQERLSGYANDVGIRVWSDAQGNLVICDVAVDSSAQKAGFMVGDIITAIDDEDVTGQSHATIQNRLDAAEKVMLTVQREGKSVTAEISVYRYVVHSVRSQVVGSIGYVRITAFYENTPTQLKEAISMLNKEGVNAMVLDLRDNRGGLQSSMQQCISYLMPLGKYGVAAKFDGTVTSLSSTEGTQLSMSTVTLINENTACEAEFVAGAMQKASLTTVLGVTSAGQGQYQEYITVKADNSAMKLTEGEYLLLGDVSFQGSGIVPSVVVPMTSEQNAIAPLLTVDTDAQILAAMAQFTIGPSMTPSTTPSASDNTTSAAE